MRRTPALIAGGGPAGAATAIRLATSGCRPLLFERTRDDHDTVCGGFLGWDTLAALESIGIDAGALGARRITTLHMVAGTRRAIVELPFAAAGLSRRTLDQALLLQAAARGAGVERGTFIRRIDTMGPNLTLADGGNVAGEAVFLATGKYDLRGAARLVPREGEVAIGFRARLDPSPRLVDALQDRIELFLFEGGYAGFLLQEDGSANLCFTAAQSSLDAASGRPERLLADLATRVPLLAERIGQARAVDGWATVARVPYGWRADKTCSGVFRLGDQAAVIASLAGDGIGIALTTGIGAADHYLRWGARSAPEFQRRFRATARRPIWIAELLRSVAQKPEMAEKMVRLADNFPGLARIAARGTRIGGY